MSRNENQPVAWCIGPHFPYGNREVLPDGIQGLDMIDEPVGNRMGYLWSGATDETKRAQSVRKIFGAMNLPEVPKHELGIVFRGHRRDGKNLADFAVEIRLAMAETAGGIATLCDSQRTEIHAILGARMIHQTSLEMTHDLDRDGLDVREFLIEWWSLLNCKRIITNCANSSLSWPHAALAAADAKIT